MQVGNLEKINFIKIGKGLLNWRQIEIRYDRTFMRFKRRSIRVYRIPERKDTEECVS